MFDLGELRGHADGEPSLIMRILLLVIALALGAADLRAQSHSAAAARGEPHATEAAAPAKAHAAPPKDPVRSAKGHPDEPGHTAPDEADASEAKKGDRTAPRAASSDELDVILQRISQKITARPGGSPTRTAQRSGNAARGAVSAPTSRVTLEWRPSVIWPAHLRPLVGDAGADHVTVAWPTVVD